MRYENEWNGDSQNKATSHLDSIPVADEETRIGMAIITTPVLNFPL